MNTTIESQAKTPRMAIWLATGFGLGYLPIAPGTWGSLGGILAAMISERIATLLMQTYFSAPSKFYFDFGLSLSQLVVGFISLVYVLCIVGVAAVGVWASREAAIHFRKPDPRPVVVDEISGQQITYLPVLTSAFGAGGWKYLLVGFILFRIFDIVKPWPARQSEKWPNGWGIMADDWFAGMYAAAILGLVRGMGWM